MSYFLWIKTNKKKIASNKRRRDEHNKIKFNYVIVQRQQKSTAFLLFASSGCFFFLLLWWRDVFVFEANNLSNNEIQLAWEQFMNFSMRNEKESKTKKNCDYEISMFFFSVLFHFHLLIFHLTLFLSSLQLCHVNKKLCIIWLSIFGDLFLLFFIHKMIICAKFSKCFASLHRLRFSFLKFARKKCCLWDAHKAGARHRLTLCQWKNINPLWFGLR